MKPKYHNSYKVWEGASLIDGAPIMVLLTLHSKNVKTGDMTQLMILRSDKHPQEALEDGSDRSICGDCPHRPQEGAKVGSCYVRISHGPASLWRSYVKGGIPTIDLHKAAGLLAGRSVRLGSYGDPAAVPAPIWTFLLGQAASHTGYTHQWRRPYAAGLKSLCMASCDSISDEWDAMAMGWRTFTVIARGGAIRANQIVCPASKEAGYKTTCEKCRLCDGSSGLGDQRKDIVIVVHGATKGRFLTVINV